MSAWEEALICGIYTVSPLHVSTGQAEGAIDLPVAKESHTGFPVIPASSLKGVARDAFERDAGDDTGKTKAVEHLFGPSLKRVSADPEASKDMSDARNAQRATDALFAGALVFTEARLVAFAGRSLNRPFLYVTSRLTIERLRRDLRAANINELGSLTLPEGGAAVLVADGPLAASTLVIEDLVYTNGVAESTEAADLGKALATLLPKQEADTRRRMEKGLIVIPDEDFAALVRRLPVRARIKLDEKKTTSGEDGNLWYEEQVPADCLFVSFVGARPTRKSSPQRSPVLGSFRERGALLQVSQIGGNETVGEGICFWTLGAQPESGEGASESGKGASESGKGAS